VVEYVDAGRTYLDGTVLIGAMDGVVRDRIRMALNGHGHGDGDHRREMTEPLGDAWVEVMGLPEVGVTGKSLVDQIEADLNEFLENAPAKVVADDDKLEEQMKRIARQVAVEEIGRKPEVIVVISRLLAE
jgi:ribonuclease J